MRPLRCFERFDPDRLAGLIGAVATLDPDELAIFQVLFCPVRHAWAESIMRAVTDGTGEPFFLNDPHVVKLATEKISSPLFAAVIRVRLRVQRVRERGASRKGLVNRSASCPMRRATNS
jgi:hypothetical protein